jgi:hypothetical protein
MVQFSIWIKGEARSNESRGSFLFTPLVALESDLDQTLLRRRLKRSHLM